MRKRKRLKRERMAREESAGTGEEEDDRRRRSKRGRDRKKNNGRGADGEKGEWCRGIETEFGEIGLSRNVEKERETDGESWGAGE